VSDIKFHSGSKLAWIEQVTIDRRSTGLEVRLAVAISRRLKDDGATIATQATLANIIGASERGVRKAAMALRTHGHLDVDSTGSGPGTATTYRPLFKRRNDSSGFEGQQIDARRNGGSGKNEAGKAEQTSRKGGTAVPPHKNPTKSPIKIPGARACQRDSPLDADPLHVCWRAIKERLARTEQWGHDKVEAWLGKLTVRELSAGILTLVSPSKFVANFNTMHHSEALLREWRGYDLSINRLQIEWRDAAPRARAR
jgi:hypothetical protein